MSATLSLRELETLATAALQTAGIHPDNAACTARALVTAEADGLASHGLSRIPFYADQALSGKLSGRAKPVVTQPAPGVIRVDAGFGLAYPAIRVGLDAALKVVPETGLVAVAVTRSHHFGAAGYHVEHVAERGYLALGFGNSPAAIAPWGGKQGSFGTNPIAFACPRTDQPPLVIDLSLSTVARGKIMLAAQRGEPIPDDWALDAEGRPTTDPQAALAGTMQPLGGAKGAALALMVEILAAALTGANPAFRASSFFDAEGSPPGVGQLFLVFDPIRFNPDFATGVTQLLDHVLAQPGTRLPGERRLANRQRAMSDGITLPGALLEELRRRSAGQ